MIDELLEAMEIAHANGHKDANGNYDPEEAEFCFICHPERSWEE